MTRDLIAGVSMAGRPGRYDIEIRNGMIDCVRLSERDTKRVVLPLLADPHVHLDKTFTEHRIKGRVGSLYDAIALMDLDKTHWTASDIRKRATHALERAYRHGVRFMRSHVDWQQADVPTAWFVLKELKQEWRGRVDLQLSSLMPLDLVADAGDAIARQVARDDEVFGAFVYCNTSLPDKIGSVFRLAHKYDLPLDFHVDEGLESGADGLSEIIGATMQFGMQGRVLCGHACSLSLREEAELTRILSEGAAAGIGLVVLPTTNLYLQDRASGRTPRLRGIAPVKEARSSGISVMFASDNCRDGFYPYGDYDLLDVFRTAVLACHLDVPDWLDAVTTTAAGWCGFEMPQIIPGHPADFIVCDAENLNDLVSRTSTRTVYRDGRAVGCPILQ